MDSDVNNVVFDRFKVFLSSGIVFEYCSRSEFSVTNYYNAPLVELCGTVLLYSDVSKVR